MISNEVPITGIPNTFLSLLLDILHKGRKKMERFMVVGRARGYRE